MEKPRTERAPEALLPFERCEMRKRLQVMKFGGTSVGDASCIARAASILVNAAKECRCVAVVSAMSGVTNRLIEATNHAEAGNAVEATAILEVLRKQPEPALMSLVSKEKNPKGTQGKQRKVPRRGAGLAEV